MPRTLLATLVRVAFTHPEARPRLLPLVKRATEFPTQEALGKYLKEHPDADRSKHHVKKQDGGGGQKYKKEHIQRSEREVRDLGQEAQKHLKGYKGPGKGKIKKLLDDIEAGGDKRTQAKDALHKWEAELKADNHKNGEEWTADQHALWDLVGEAKSYANEHHTLQHMKDNEEGNPMDSIHQKRVW